MPTIIPRTMYVLLSIIGLVRNLGVLLKRDAVELVAEILPPPARKAELREEVSLEATDRVFQRKQIVADLPRINDCLVSIRKPHGSATSAMHADNGDRVERRATSRDPQGGPLLRNASARTRC